MNSSSTPSAISAQSHSRWLWTRSGFDVAIHAK